MTASASLILAELEAVEFERRRRAATPGLQARVQSVKAYQQKRFSHTYADLLAHRRYVGAARFFLDELYGPGDFSQRDAQFARVVPALVRLFPQDVVDTVWTLSRLHALSEQLDSEMGCQLPGEHADAQSYLQAWRGTGRAAERDAQVDLVVSVGASLDNLTRRPLLRQTLRMMRGPARAAGLSALQGFLEKGFDTFQAMRGASEFLDTVSTRERALALALFDTSDATGRSALGQLP
jgi:hypothetical protein